MVRTTRDVELEKVEQAKRDADQLELDYLRYFFDAVDSALGPASDDVYEIIAENYTGTLPDKYNPEIETDD